MFSAKIPLSWLVLTRDKMRLLVALAGVAFAVILMFMQFGFQNALFDSATMLHSKLKGDVFLIDPRSISLVNMRQFSQRRLYQALATDGAESAMPVYTEMALWKNHVTKKPRSIFVIAFRPEHDVIDIPEVSRNLPKLRMLDTVLFDELSRAEFGPVAEDFQKNGRVDTEIGGRRHCQVIGLFKLGPTFGGDGTIITSDLTFAKLGLYRARKTGLIDIGVIKAKPGVDAQQLAFEIKKKLPRDVRVLTKKEFIAFEKHYWMTSTAIGFIFSLGAFIGFIVGAAIVYQILYSDVYEHLKEYATLKAIGYSNKFLEKIVFEEAVTLSILGFIPGVVITYLLYDMTRDATLLPMSLQADRLVVVLLLTLVMCVVSGFLAMRKLKGADPAEVF